MRNVLAAAIIMALLALVQTASDQADRVGAPGTSAPRAWTED